MSPQTTIFLFLKLTNYVDTTIGITVSFVQLEHMTLSNTDLISFVCALLKKVFGKVSFRRELTMEQLFPSHFAPCNLSATLCVYEVLYECTFRSI